MSKRNDRIYLQDIIDNIVMAENFLTGLTFEDFSKDSKTAQAVIRCLEIIGEAAKHIPQTMRYKYAGVPWKEMAGMRDKLAHEYFSVVLKVVWRAVKEEIPKTKYLIIEILS